MKEFTCGFWLSMTLCLDYKTKYSDTIRDAIKINYLPVPYAGLLQKRFKPNCNFGNCNLYLLLTWHLHSARSSVSLYATERQCAGPLVRRRGVFVPQWAGPLVRKRGVFVPQWAGPLVRRRGVFVPQWAGPLVRRRGVFVPQWAGPLVRSRGVFVPPVKSSCTSDPKQAIFGAWLNKCCVYNEEDVLCDETCGLF